MVLVIRTQLQVVSPMLGLFRVASSHFKARTFVRVFASVLPLLVLLAAAAILPGCGKKAAAPAVPPPAAETQPVPPDQPIAASTSPPAATLTQADGQVDLPELQRSVLRWVLAHRRRPASFEEFAATAGVQIPPAPTGKKYILTKDLHVQVVNR